MLVFDAHLDLSLNALFYNRDLTREVAQVREREAGMTDKKGRAVGTVTLPAMRQGEVGLCIATQIAHSKSQGSPLAGWSSPEIAWAVTQSQIAWYQAMESAGQLKQITDRASLAAHVEQWTTRPSPEAPVGFLLSLEGADSILNAACLETAYGYGLRAIGPAHYGPGIYAAGTGEVDGFTSRGRDLLRQMMELEMVLDMTHLTDEGFWEALELFDGPVWASHNNCRSLVPHQRQLDDQQINALLEREAVIGVALDAWMMVPNWVKGESDPRGTGCNLEVIVTHIDHICQLAGNASYVGIGSDLDGGFGREQSPYDLDTIADLQLLADMLTRRGYSEADTAAILHGNWIRKLHEVLK